MLMNLWVECLHKLFEILLHGRFLFLLGLFVSFSKVLFIYMREREEKNMSDRGRGRGRSRFPAEQGACLGTWIMICA